MQILNTNKDFSKNIWSLNYVSQRRWDVHFKQGLIVRLPSSNVFEAWQKIINLHNAKLPDYRGHNSISHEILNGETKHTTTIHKIAKEVDRGEILLEKEIDCFK